MNIIVKRSYANKINGDIVEVTGIFGGIVTFIEMQLNGAAGLFQLSCQEFEKQYTDNTQLDERKECFACKGLIDLIHQVEYKGAYYHDGCLMNGKPINDDRDICLGCEKPINHKSGVIINGDHFHFKCTPEGDPDYSKLLNNNKTMRLPGYPNGEITFNYDNKQYTVWNETYTDSICVTNYPEVAKAALKAYGEYYL